MPPRKRVSAKSSRASSTMPLDSDAEGIAPQPESTEQNSPATSLEVEEEAKDATYDPVKDEEKQVESNGQESAKPVAQTDGSSKTLKEAYKAMVSKAAVYMKRIEEHKQKMREARGETVAEDAGAEEAVEGDDDTVGKKRKSKPSEKAKANKKQKTTAPAVSAAPPRLPQSKLITGGTLKGYQIDGMNWIIERYIFALFGAILADEMGTGKTLQTISFIAFLHENIHHPDRPETDKPTLIILPKAVLRNWDAEFKRFAPSIPLLTYYGTPPERAEIRKDRLGLTGLKRAKRTKRKERYPVILTTYNIAIKDVAFLEQLDYDLIVCDEAHKAKNLKGKTLTTLKRYRADFRLLLTGTPLQNNLEELYALLTFILPSIFNDAETFNSMFNFSQITNSDGSKLSESDEVTLLIAQLQNILKPFMLRRCKKDVVKDLPLKKEYVLTAPLTPRQKELTDVAVKGELRAFLAGESSEEATQQESQETDKEEDNEDVESVDFAKTTKRPTRRVAAKKSYVDKIQDAADDDQFEADLIEKTVAAEQEKEKAELERLASKSGLGANHQQAKFTSVMTNLRQIANHPLSKLDDRKAGVEPNFEDVVNLSGKMMLLDRLLPELFKRGHKVLIFSQFVTMLDLLDEYIIDVKGWNRYRIDGRQGNSANQDEIEEFNTTPLSEESTNIFLLSTRAGGVGINLVGADTVILFDSDWNPQNDLQAMDRAHRIGQTKPVLVFRFASANTVEQTILANATRKRKLERVVLGTDDLAGDGAGDILNKAKGKKMTKNDNMRMLAEQLANAEGEKITLAGAGAEILTDEQLEALLDRSEEAMKSDNSSGQGKSTTAAFEVVDTIEESEVQTKNVLEDLLANEDDGEASATTSDGEDA
ncbi:DEAD/DEAH box helicase [Sporobolomyces salmoneus]|uniref:DEAD/DEAH box helicase n=1 Tax=Sporobolomyces salmoneus TaxID=183962 RepID=UPI0031792D78